MVRLAVAWVPGKTYYLDNTDLRSKTCLPRSGCLTKQHFFLGDFTSALILLEAVTRAIKNILLLHQNQKLFIVGSDGEDGGACRFPHPYVVDKEAVLGW